MSPAWITAPRTPVDIVLGYHVEVAGGEPEMYHPSRSHSKPEPEHSVPLAQDPYLTAEEVGDRDEDYLTIAHAP